MDDRDTITAEEADERMDARASGWAEGYRPQPKGEDQ